MITLRSFKNSDIDLLVSYLNDNEVTQYITGAIPQPYTETDAQWWVNNSMNSEFTKAVEFNGTFVGCISAKRGEFEYSRSAELGYWIGREFWNQGIATQAVQEFTELLFKTTNIVRLFVSVVSINTGSIRILDKNGYVLEGILKQSSCKNERYYDEHLFSKIKLIIES
ncbi:MAG: GNAT family N-acetyltransferase [Gammaproteobacteria bacterium]|nr:GNAT family N-acetyltransferase [Gammaproteobacteria bacterium]